MTKIKHEVMQERMNPHVFNEEVCIRKTDGVNKESIKELIVASLGFVAFLAGVGLVFFALYIGMVAEPDCQRKGFASADSNGCWIIKNGERVYENN